MKKSEIYQMAMKAILRDDTIKEDDVIEALSVLNADKVSALYWEDEQKKKEGAAE